MTDGALRCVGAPLHLKNRFGQGFTLTLALAARADVAAQRGKVEAYVRSCTEDAVGRNPRNAAFDAFTVYSLSSRVFAEKRV